MASAAQTVQTIQLGQERPYQQVAAERFSQQMTAPVVLTAQTLLRERDDITSGLRHAQFDLRYVAAWSRLPEAIERIKADIVLVDMDAVDQLDDGTHQLSGYRLVSLLARQVARQLTQRPIALVIMTHLDFTEIEELARAGVHAIVAPTAKAQIVVEHVRIALHNARRRHAPSSKKVVAVAEATRPMQPPHPADRNESEQEHLWQISDQSWQRIEALLPTARRSARVRLNDRRALEAMFFLLHSGTPWSKLPVCFGSVASVRTRLRRWAACGVMEELLAVGLEMPIAWNQLHWKRLPGIFPPMVALLAKNKHYRLAD